jgi:hypothetical protein
LVYTSVYEEQGTYIFADGSLWDRPDDVKQLLFRVFANHLPGTYETGQRHSWRTEGQRIRRRGR